MVTKAQGELIYVILPDRKACVHVVKQILDNNEHAYFLLQYTVWQVFLNLCPQKSARVQKFVDATAAKQTSVIFTKKRAAEQMFT